MSRYKKDNRTNDQIMADLIRRAAEHTKELTEASEQLAASLTAKHTGDDHE